MEWDFLLTLALIKTLAAKAANRARERLRNRFVINPQNPYKVSVCSIYFPTL